MTGLVDELREALRPFAEAMDAYGDPKHLDNMYSALHAIREGELTITGVSLGDFRRARRARSASDDAHASTQAELAAMKVELAEIRTDLLAGQGDDDGEQILPDFQAEWSVAAMVQKCVFLLEYRRDIIDGLRSTLSKTRAALEAAEAQLTAAKQEGVKAGEVEVIPLVWEHHPAGGYSSVWTNFGTRISVYRDWGLPGKVFAVNTLGGVFSTIEEAKDAAQADYEQRIRSALKAPASPWRPMKDAPRQETVLVAYRNRLGNWRVVRATYYAAGTLEADDHCTEEMIDEGGFAPAGWYEESETHDYILPLDEHLECWHPIPKVGPLPDAEPSVEDGAA